DVVDTDGIGTLLYRTRTGSPVRRQKGGTTSTQARCRKNDSAWRRLVAPGKDNGKHRQKEKPVCARNGIRPVRLYGIVRKILVKYMQNKTLRLYPARRTIHRAARGNESTNRLWSR